MTLDNFKEFITLAELRHYQLAADRLFTTQASLSRHIISMEEELGFELFDRSHRRVELTDKGFRFLIYAQRALDIQEKYTAEIKKKLREVNGQLVIGSHRSSTYYNISNLLGLFSKEFPNIQISVTETKTEALREMVRTNQCDFAFVRELQTSHSTIDCLPILKDSLVVVLSSDHSFASRSSITLEALQDEEFMLPPENSSMRNTYLHIFHKHGIVPKQSNIVGNSGRNILQFVKQGICVALYWKKTAEAICGPETTIVDITPPIYVSINMLYKKDLKSYVKTNFLKFICDQVETMTPDSLITGDRL